MHALDPPAEHGLNGIGSERVLQRNDEINILQVFLQPALNALVQIAHVLEHNCAFALDIKGQDSAAAEFPHHANKLAAGLNREHIAMKGFALERSRNGAV